MAGELMSVLWDRSKWEKTLAAARAGLGDMTPLMHAIGMKMVRSVKTTLRESGSPADSFAPLSAATLSSGRKPGKPLIDTGNLLGGIKVVLTAADRVELASTGLKYSGIHQFGAHITGTAFGDITIPPRPFMVFRPRDPAMMQLITKRYVDKVLGEGAFAGLLMGLGDVGEE